MPSEPVVGTWRRYKAGTAKVLKWLRESSPSSPTSSKATCTSAINGQLLATADLLPLAQSIVDAEDKITIPISILTIVQDVMFCREQFADWYKTLALCDKDKSLQEANDRHQHFIKVLIRVFDILRAKAKDSRPKRKKTIPELSPTGKTLSNIFQMLELEDIGDVGEDVSEVASADWTKKPAQKKSSPMDATPDYRLEDDEHHEREFAIWAVLRDLQEIRGFHQRTWSRCASGELSFITAVFLTDKAIHLAMLLEKELQQSYSELNEYAKLLAWLPVPDFGINDIGSEYADLFCFEAYTSLFHFKDLQCFFWCKRNCPQYRLPVEQNVPFPEHPFSTVLWSISKHFNDLLPKHNTKGVQSEDWLTYLYSNMDRYTHGLLDLASRGQIGVAMVCATQMHFDIYDALNGDMSRGLHEAWTLTSNTQHILREYAAFCAEATTYARTHTIPVEEFVARFPFLKSRFEDVGWSIQEGEGRRKPIVLPLDLLSALPLLSGMQADRHLRALQAAGGELFNHDQGLLSIAYLYQAARDCNPNMKKWTDLEKLLSDQPAQFVCLGSDTLSTAKQFDMALGLSLSKANLERDQVPSLPRRKFCAKNARKFLEKAVLERGAVKSWDMHVSLGFHQAAGLQMHYEGVKEYLAHGGTIKNADIARQWEKTKKLTSRQLLDLLAEIVVEEEPHLQFDYLRFFMTYLRVLCGIRDDYITSSRGSTQAADDSLSIYGIVHCIFWGSGKAEKKGMRPEDTSLARAVKAVEDFIEQSGRSFFTHSPHAIGVDEHLAEVEKEIGNSEPTCFGENNANAITSLLQRVHACHTHQDIDNLIYFISGYHQALADGKTPADAEKNMWPIVDHFTKQNVDVKALISDSDGKFTRNQMRVFNQISYDNGAAHSGDISPEHVEKTLKEATSTFWQETHSIKRMIQENYRSDDKS